MQKAIAVLLLSLSILLAGCSISNQSKLENSHISIDLGYNENGIPVIQKISSAKYTIISNTDKSSINDWLPEIKKNSSISKWQVEQDSKFIKARATATSKNLTLAWNVELPKNGGLFRTYIDLVNNGQSKQSIASYPVWIAQWNYNSDKLCKLDYWQPLTYTPFRQSLNTGTKINLNSAVYSSDKHKPDGKLPFWQVEHENGAVFYSIGWSGGWNADISQSTDGTHMQVSLPPSETQLVLEPGESVTGPMFYILSSSETSQSNARKEWLTQRNNFANLLYEKPENWYPFLYNHWYSVRFDLSSTFIKNQIDTMLPYNFDLFVVDAGWYASPGDWVPDPAKFKPGEFEKALKYVKDNGILAGIWSCPWLLRVEGETLPPEIDNPPFYRDFMDAYGMDLAGTDFTKYLHNHIEHLTDQFYMDWWKYDQELFGDNSRHGKMKNIIALQDALEAVRIDFPKLNIENCMSGGRMINEFTDQIAQSHWIRDGSRNGMQHAQSNISEAIGAIQLLDPAKVQRWTNRIDELDENDTELIKLYCRSCMIGVWGISTDMAKVTEKQKQIILEQIKIYRKLNELKPALEYDIWYPNEQSDFAGVIYYDQQHENAAVLLYNRKPGDEINAELKVRLNPDTSYILHNADTETGTEISGKSLTNGEYVFHLNKGELSGVYFINTK